MSIELPISFESLGGQDQQVAAAQIVFTVTTFTGIKGVRFLVGGQVAHVPTGDGSLTRGPSTEGSTPRSRDGPRPGGRWAPAGESLPTCYTPLTTGSGETERILTAGQTRSA